jgi:RHS repeat-associated protein
VYGLGLDDIEKVGGQAVLRDSLGSVTGRWSGTEVSGSVTDGVAFAPFGESALDTSGFGGFGFAGMESDGNGLYYARNRYYSPHLGRFISEDPIGFAGGLNLYAYCGNDPVNFIDPEGLQPARPFQFVTPPRTGRGQAQGPMSYRIWLSQQARPRSTFGAARPGTPGGGGWGWNSNGAMAFTPPTAESLFPRQPLNIPFLGSPNTSWGSNSSYRCKGINPAAYDRAIAARDAMKWESNSKRPAAWTAGYNVVTGEVATGRSGGGRCAEDDVVRQLGGDSGKVFFVPASGHRNDRGLCHIPVCQRCQTKYSRSQFGPGTLFQGDGYATTPLFW